MSDVYRFVLHPPDKLLNQNDRLHWAATSKIKRSWKQVAHFTAVDLKNRGLIKPIVEGQAIVTISIPVKTNRRRDGHNYSPTAKCIIDGMVTAKIFIDDSTKYLYLNDIQFHIGDQVIVTYMQSKVAPSGAYQ